VKTWPATTSTVKARQLLAFSSIINQDPRNLSLPPVSVSLVWISMVRIPVTERVCVCLWRGGGCHLVSISKPTTRRPLPSHYTPQLPHPLHSTAQPGGGGPPLPATRRGRGWGGEGRAGEHVAGVEVGAPCPGGGQYDRRPACRTSVNPGGGQYDRRPACPTSVKPEVVIDELLLAPG